MRCGCQQSWPPASLVGGGRQDRGWDRVPRRLELPFSPGERVLWILSVASGVRGAGSRLCSVPGVSGALAAVAWLPPAG